VRAARKAVRPAVVWVLLLAAALGAPPRAWAASSARLNILVDIQGVGSVNDLTAVSGVSTGTINLSWTEPYHPGATAPFAYDVRVSSISQISDDAAFIIASPLSSVSPAVPPVPGSGGGGAAFIVDHLTEDVTYYFAIRENDSTTKHGVWLRNISRNVNNFAVATSTKPAMPASGAFLAVFESSMTAAWDVSINATDYVLIASTNSSLSPIAASSTTVSSTATLSGLSPNATYYVGVSACRFGCSAFLNIGSTITLAVAVTGLSTTAVNSTSMDLSWSLGGNPAGTRVLLQSSLDGVVFTPAFASTSTAGSLGGLSPGVTYYLRAVAVNGAGTEAAPSGVLSVLTPTGPVPSSPTGLAVAAGRLSVALSWDALPPASQGSGLGFYRVWRSLSAGSGYVSLTTTTATAYLDKPLAAGTAYYYKVSARDIAFVEGPLSAAVSATPYTAPPMEPLGVKVQSAPTSVTLSWSPTTRFFDGTPFISTGTPTGDELAGYSVYRSTNICEPFFVHVASLAVTDTTLTDATGGQNYYYRLFSYNSVGVSSNAVTLSTLGERSYFLDDCVSRAVLDDATAASLNGSVNGVGDILIARARRPQDVGGGVFQSVEWKAELAGASEMKNFVLPKPARIVLHFDVQNGKVVPSTASVGALSAMAPAAAAGGSSIGELGVFWYNGVEFKKMYGRIDAAAQTVTVESPNLGVYQVRSMARAAGAVFDLSNLSSRVITPNGDGLNDVAIFTYDPGPANIQAAGRIFDLQGAAVAEMAPGLVPNTLVWDGRMNGRPATGGVYVYRITGDGKTFTGTIVVAR